MPIISIESDPKTLTLTAIGEYPVPLERLWSAWADPRQLELFWGPPPWPATFTRHEMRAGGRSEYFMTGPNGERSCGYWIFERVIEGERFVVRDGFLSEGGEVDASLPSTRMEVTFEATASGSRFTAVSTFDSVEAMETILAMGAAEGLSCALGQLDDVVADLREMAAGVRTELVLEGDTCAVVRRVVRGTIDLVWRAHHEAELLKRWMLGPEGWTMPVCEVAGGVGGVSRYEWVSASGEGRFGFLAEVLELEAPRRSLTIERMIGVEGPGTTNEMLLTPQPGGRTMIEIRITYPSKGLRERILETGMVEGMEASYARLEALIG